MKEETQISTKVLQALYKIQTAELMLFKDDLYAALNSIKEGEALIKSEIQEQFGLDK